MPNYESIRSYAEARYNIVGETRSKRLRGRKGGAIIEVNITAVDPTLPTDNQDRGSQATMGFTKTENGDFAVTRLTRFRNIAAAERVLKKQG